MHNRHSNQIGAAVGSLVAFVALILIAAYVIFFMLGGSLIPPGFFGVRQTKFGPWQGFSVSGLKPGLHWGDPGGMYSVVHVVPQTLQTLHFHKEGTRQDPGLPPLEVQTSDRATVDVDVTVLTSFYDAPGRAAEGYDHGGPADLLQKVGISEQQWRNHIRRTVEDELKRALGSISTGQFYDPELREKQILAARSNMDRSLALAGIRVEAVLLRRYSYRDDRIDQAIFQKNLQDQEERLNVQASKLAEAQATLEQVEAELDAKIKTLQLSGENQSRVIRSEGQLAENEKIAQGELEVARARAEVDRQRSQVMSQAGSEVYVARELAAILSSIKGGVVSDLDPYDLQAWTRRLGVQGGNNADRP